MSNSRTFIFVYADSHFCLFGVDRFGFGSVIAGQNWHRRVFLPGLTISFRMPGNSSRVIEAEVTSKLESMLARVNGIKNVISTSDNGGGSITLELDKHADIDAARLKCQPLSAKRGRSCLTESAILRLVPAVRMIKASRHL